MPQTKSTQERKRKAKKKEDRRKTKRMKEVLMNKMSAMIRSRAYGT